MYLCQHIGHESSGENDSIAAGTILPFLSRERKISSEWQQWYVQREARWIKGRYNGRKGKHLLIYKMDTDTHNPHVKATYPSIPLPPLPYINIYWKVYAEWRMPSPFSVPHYLARTHLYIKAFFILLCTNEHIVPVIPSSADDILRQYSLAAVAEKWKVMLKRAYSNLRILTQKSTVGGIVKIFMNIFHASNWGRNRRVIINGILKASFHTPHASANAKEASATDAKVY